jgi:hypothetical protein
MNNFERSTVRICVIFISMRRTTGVRCVGDVLEGVFCVGLDFAKVQRCVSL